MIRYRIAQTKTEETAWRLIGRLRASETINTFCVVRRSPTGRYEIEPEEPVHPIDKKIIARVVAEFKDEMS